MQVSRDRVKTKDPALTAKITLEGRWCAAVIDGGHGVRCSRQLSEEAAGILSDCLKDTEVPKPITLILRTKAGELVNGGADGFVPLTAEAKKLLERAQTLLKIGRTRTVFSLISEEKPEWLAVLQEQKTSFDKVVTDEPAVHSALSGRIFQGRRFPFIQTKR